VEVIHGAAEGRLVHVRGLSSISLLLGVDDDVGSESRA